MSRQHTPGPWRFNQGTCHTDRGAIVGHNDDKVCDFGNSEQYYPTEGTEPDPADLALILAAPAMYEALKDLITVHDNPRFNKPNIPAARAALALAEGRRP